MQLLVLLLNACTPCCEQWTCAGTMYAATLHSTLMSSGGLGCCACGCWLLLIHFVPQADHALQQLAFHLWHITLLPRNHFCPPTPSAHTCYVILSMQAAAGSYGEASALACARQPLSAAAAAAATNPLLLEPPSTINPDPTHSHTCYVTLRLQAAAGGYRKAGTLACARQPF
jgi:hypothetical protein